MHLQTIDNAFGMHFKHVENNMTFAVGARVKCINNINTLVLSHPLESLRCDLKPLNERERRKMKK
jgi:hypothetical protein